MAIAISSSRADSDSMPGVVFKWVLCSNWLEAFKSGPVHWLVDPNYQVRSRDTQTHRRTQPFIV